MMMMAATMAMIVGVAVHVVVLMVTELSVANQMDD